MRLLVYISVAAGLAGIALAYLFYVARPGLADAFTRRLGGLYTLVYNKYFVDEIYERRGRRPLVEGSTKVLWRGVDAGLIDGTVNGVGTQAHRRGSAFCGCCKSGNIRSYAAWVVLGSRAGHPGVRVHRGCAVTLLNLCLALPLAGFLLLLAGPARQARMDPLDVAGRFRW